MQTKTLPVLVALGVLFGSAFLSMHVLVEEIAVTEVVAGRLLLGAVTVFAIMAAMRRSPRVDVSILPGAALLVILDSVIPHTLIARAQLSIDSGVAAVLVSTMPMFTVAFAAVALPEDRLSTRGMIGLAVGFLGVIVLTEGDIFHVSGAGTAGMLAVIAAAASYGAASVYARFLLRRADALSLTGTKLALGALIAFSLTFVIEGVPDYGALSVEGSVALLALGVLSTGVAFTLYFWLVGAAGSVYASTVTYMVPVVGLLLGWAVLGENIGPATIAGGALIALGVAGVMHHPSEAPQQSRSAPAPRLALCAEPASPAGREEFA